MHTQILNAHHPADLTTAFSLLKAGELVAVPTETVYGLAADATNPDAVRKIFTAKNRPTTHPLIVHIASFDTLHVWAKNIPPSALLLAKHFWPGPLTLLLHKADEVSDVVTGNLPTIGIRVPDNPTLLTLLHTLNTGLAAPSANPHKHISPTTAEHVYAGLAGKIAAIIDAGPCAIGLESTIVDLTGDLPHVVRPGPITPAMLEAVLHMPVLTHSDASKSSPGNMAVHYQPHTPTFLMSLSAIQQYISLPEHQNRTIAIMHHSDFAPHSSMIKTRRMSTEKSAYAAMLYHTLHAFDNMGVAQIIIEAPPQAAEWSDVWDRLSKACGKRLGGEGGI